MADAIARPPTATLQFLGAAGTVTGSKHLIATDRARVLLDCGLFQGLKALRERNWSPFPFDPAGVDAVVLSHAHIDHSGALPLLVKRGFRGPIHCTSGTADLLEILLLDSAGLQEEDARYANRHRASKHVPALPLYTTDDARRALALVDPHAYGEEFEVAHELRVVLRRAGHILGSATVDALVPGRVPVRVLFSGDLGRYGRPILRSPETVREADVVLVESTYGDRHHAADPSDELARIVIDVAERRGTLLVPAFAVDRTQELLYVLRSLEDAGRIPQLPLFIDSPMAIEVTDLYARHGEDHDLDMRALVDHGRSPLSVPRTRLLRTSDDSKSLNDASGPMIVISSSGMATGGRILHHLFRRLPDPSTTVLLVGYQAAGTRGRALQDGAPTVRIFGHEVPVRARVAKVDGFSAHADQSEILRWLGEIARPPRATWCVHGEPQSADTLAAAIRHRLGWDARVAQDGAVVPLD
ncbi:MAG TPA: MBL fold metallo-hydrolase [Candidatus Binatia bacterium]|nr:MBL fold metallo-hydrolase [Candidatus Binatia bacterium]